MWRFDFLVFAVFIFPVFFHQALEKVRTLEADNQSIEQVGFVFTLIQFMGVGWKHESQSKHVASVLR